MRKRACVAVATAMVIWAVLGGAGVAQATPTCTVTWTGAAGDGHWGTAGNWSSGVPTASDHVCLGSSAVGVSGNDYEAATVQGAGTIIISGGRLDLGDATEVSQLSELRTGVGGAVAVAATLQILDVLATQGGELEGPGTVAVAGSAEGTLAHSGLDLADVTLLNEGLITVEEGSLDLGSGSTLDNRGTLAIEDANVGGSIGHFRNTGLVRKTKGTGISVVNVDFDNGGGEVEVAEGRLRFTGGADATTGTGQWSGEGVGTVAFSDTEFQLGDEAQFSGIVAVEGNAKVVVGSVSGEDAHVVLPSGRLVLDDPAATSHVGQLTGSWVADVAVAGTLRVTDAFQYEGGALEGPGTVVLEETVTGTLVVNGLDLEDDVTLINHGTITQVVGDLSIGDTSVFDNRGTFNTEKDDIEGVTGRFRNTGLVRKTKGTGISVVNVDFDNGGGEVEVAEGRLRFTGGADATTGVGQWSGEGVGTVAFSGAEFELGEEAQFSGIVAVEGNADVFVGSVSGEDAHVVLPSGRLVLDDPAATSHVGKLTGSWVADVAVAGTLRVTDAFRYEGGALQGPGSVLLEEGVTGTLVVNGLDLEDDVTLINHGTTTLQAGRLDAEAGTVVDNYGTFAVEGDRTLAGTDAFFFNRGTLVKTAGSGTSQVSFDVGNGGTIREEAGKFEFLGAAAGITVEGSEQLGPGNEAMPNLPRPCAGKPVNCATGNQYESQTDLFTPGRGVGLGLVRTYNSRAAAAALVPGPLGYGWTSSFSDRLEVNAPAQLATVHQADGSTVSFSMTPNGDLIAPPRVHATLTENVDGSYTYLLPDRRRMKFSSNGRLASVADRNGNTTTVSYDGSGRLSTITDPASRTITLTYDGNGRVATATDPTGLDVTYGYDDGDLVSVTYEGAAEPRWEFGYDGEHQMTSMIDGRGGETTTTYDGSNRVIAQEDALDRERTWDYSAGETKITNPAGDVTIQRFGAHGQLVETTWADGTAAEGTETIAYDADLNPISRTDADQETTTFGYDAAGNRTSVTDPNDLTTKWTYDAHRNVTSTTTPSGRVTTFTYDGNDNLKSVSRTLELPGPDETQTTTFDYDGNGLLEESTNPLDKTWIYDHDAAGNLVSETSPTGDEATWEYDAASRVIASVSPRGNELGADPEDFETEIARDAYGRAVEIADPLGKEQTIDYDANNNVVEMVDGAGRTVELTYDAEDQPTHVERAGIEELTAYDDNGRVISQTNGAGKTTTYDRDEAGRVVLVTDPLDRETAFDYDPAGTLEEVTDELSRTTAYAYDPGGRLTGVDYSDAATPDVTFDYDDDGRRTEMTDGSGTSTYAYDSLDRLTETTNGAGETVAYEYDIGDRLVGLTYPNEETLARGFDDSGRLVSITDWLGNTTEFEYDADSNLIGTELPAATNVVTGFDQDAAGRLAGIEIEGPKGPLASLAYTRNGSGQVDTTSWTGLPGSGPALSYDASTRLDEAGADDYAYDDAANPTLLGDVTGLAYDDAGQLQEATDPGGLVELDYDGLGDRVEVDPTTGPTTTYGYDQDSRLTSVKRGGDPDVVYGYDGDGLRVSKERSSVTTEFAWDVAAGLPLLLSDGDASYVYGPTGLPLAQIDGTDVLYHHQDQLGSTRVLTDAKGDVAGTFSYDAYGNPTGSTGSASSPFGFAGEYRDEHTGLVYLRARHYDPATGQFLTRDPLEGISRQPYLYANGDPVNEIDPTGMLPSLGEIFSEVSNGAAGALDGLTGGLSTDLAGAVFGFSADCADFGGAFGVTQVLGSLPPIGRLGKGLRAARGELSAAPRPMRNRHDLSPTHPFGPPGPDFEWRGPDKGSWWNPRTNESWRPDPTHGPPKGPHWDYRDPNGHPWRVYPDGRIERK